MPLGVFLRLITGITNISRKDKSHGHHGHHLETTSAPDGQHCGKVWNWQNVNKDMVNIVKPAANYGQSMF